MTGAFVTHLVYDKGATTYMTTQYAAEVNRPLMVLTPLRAGDTNSAIKLLEIQLDGGLVGLGAICEETSAHLDDSMVRRVLERARDYRLKFSTGSSVPSQQVDDALALIDD
jgi:hypothetical protein